MPLCPTVGEMNCRCVQVLGRLLTTQSPMSEGETGVGMLVMLHYVVSVFVFNFPAHEAVCHVIGKLFVAIDEFGVYFVVPTGWGGFREGLIGLH